MHDVENIRVTVGITTYNRPDFLRQSVMSVLQQSYKNFEIVISNDYIDTPVTFECLGIPNDERVKIVNQKKNLGEVLNMNYLLEVSQSEWFVWLSDDDLIHPEFLMQATACIRENIDKDIVAFYSDYSSASTPAGIFPGKLYESGFIRYKSSQFINEYTSKSITLIGTYGVMKVDALKKIGGFPQLGHSFSPYSDTLIPLLLSAYGSIYMQNEPLVFLRTHSNSLSCMSSDFLAYTSAEIDFLKQLKRVCQSETVNVQFDKIIANMVRWFAGDEWAVLSRTEFTSKVQLVLSFIDYQVKVNFKRLSLFYKFLHLIFLCKFFTKITLHKIYRMPQTILKA